VATDTNAEDELAARRLKGLLDYVEALVKLDERVATRLAQHKLADGSQFILHQHELAGLPSLRCDIADQDGPIWLRIQRLQRTSPPRLPGPGAEWMELSNDPLRVPVIHDVLHARVTQAEHQRLLMDGEVRPEDCAPSLQDPPESAPGESFFDVMLRLEDRPGIRAALEAYAAGPWVRWSETERPRRMAIGVYQRLFEIAQRLSQMGGTESVELIWGIGLAKWNKAGELIDLPMIECGVEIEIAETGNADITIRPRGGVARVELRAFEKLAGPRFVQAEDAARRCLRALEGPDSEGISPFRPDSYEPILRICGAQLDPEGRYLPDQHSLPAGEAVPEAEGDVLTVSDRYVIYARRRSSNSVLQDIDRLKRALSDEDGTALKIEGAARTLVLGPGDGIDDTFVPLGNTIGRIDTTAFGADDPVDPDHGDLFFPKPFNDEQVDIIRRLERSDGLVVQGPPGTGKTHTIANIISHMLATGRRVLVVSHGETALRVIQDQLPEGVRDLAISVTTSEREGMKQVEKAIGLMLGIVNAVDSNRGRQAKLIAELEAQIVANRKRLSAIDRELDDIARQHFTPLPGSKELPFIAAKRLMEEQGRHGWFEDRPARIFADCDVTQADADALLAARKSVKADLKYLGEPLPSPANLPDIDTLRSWHDDLVAAKDLTAITSASELQTRRVIARLGSEGAEALADSLKHIAALMTGIRRHAWAAQLSEAAIRAGESFQRLEPVISAFVSDARDISGRRAQFLSLPVELPRALPADKALFAILDTLVAGKNPFGILAFGARAHQPTFEAIRVAGRKPASSADWQQVRSYVEYHGMIVSLAARWRSLGEELDAPESIDFGPGSLQTLDGLADMLHACLVTIPVGLREASSQLSNALGSRDEVAAILRQAASISVFASALSRHVASIRLASVNEKIQATIAAFAGSTADLAGFGRQILTTIVGQPQTDVRKLTQLWQALLDRLTAVKGLEPLFDRIVAASAAIESAGAPQWAQRLRTEPATDEGDPAMPAGWRDAWDWAAHMTYLRAIGATDQLALLHDERLAIEKQLREGFAKVVKERTFLNLAGSMTGAAKSALQGFANTIRRLGAGSGQRAVLHRQNARQAMQGCYDAVPCWIMPTWRVCEQLPARLASFDLVILDEASQSDARELPALLRGKKVLVVGDDRQVSPSSAFLSIANIARLRQNFLSEFPYRAEVEPGASLYDLARVMFPAKFVMLKEHFRCVEPIIRFAMQFYNESLIPLRIPTPGERLDPPLIDIHVEDGERRGKSKVNPREAEVILDEIAALVAQSANADAAVRSIGVISLIGADQAHYIQKQLMERIGEAAMVRHRIVCGDSATLQGDERDIVFISMIADKAQKPSQTSLQYQQRFNVALSRARDRMVLVRSVREEDLNPKDLKAKVIAHFRGPMPDMVDPGAGLIDLCQSDFERAIFTALIERGYRVTPQVGSVGFAIDMVVEGEGGRRLAIECDGDQYHGPERWAGDMRRQRILERVGWTFWRCFGSNFRVDPAGTLEDLVATLERMKIKPLGLEPVPQSYTEHRTSRAAPPVDGAQEDSTAIQDAIEDMVQTEAASPIVPGDRVTIRYLDQEPSRPEFYTISDASDDRLNGYLLLSSPLGQALATQTAGDEFTFRDGAVERPVLFVAHEGAAAQAA
jgi:very-short-patch-repair endonuclease